MRSRFLSMKIGMLLGPNAGVAAVMRCVACGQFGTAFSSILSLACMSTSCKTFLPSPFDIFRLVGVWTILLSCPFSRLMSRSKDLVPRLCCYPQTVSHSYSHHLPSTNCSSSTARPARSGFSVGPYYCRQGALLSGAPRTQGNPLSVAVGGNGSGRGGGAQCARLHRLVPLLLMARLDQRRGTAERFRPSQGEERRSVLTRRSGVVRAWSRPARPRSRGLPGRSGRGERSGRLGRGGSFGC
jgi:hypothetical protein